MTFVSANLSAPYISRLPCRSRTRLEKLVIGVWIALFLAVSVRVMVSRPRSHNDYPTYANTGRNWIQGQDLYYQYDSLGNYDDFRYSPLVAVIFAGSTAVADPIGNVLWRAFNLVVFLGGLGWWCRKVLPESLERSHIALVFLLVLPLAAANVNNGQCNLVILGSLLAGVAAAADKRWMVSAAFLAFAALFKVYPAALALLLIAVYPRALGWRFLLALSVGILVPFLFQNSGYVNRQYETWMGYWFQEDRELNVGQVLYRDLRLVFRVWLDPLNGKVYLAIQMLTALGAAAACVTAKRAGWSERRLLFMLLGLGCCWMTIFGVSAESCTYVLVAPCLAGGLITSHIESRPWFVRCWFWASFGLFLASLIAKWFPRGAEVFDNRASDPIAGLLLLAGLLAAELTRRPCPVSDSKLPLAA